MSHNYNVAIIGQTGVGKSSLINYLFDGNVVETGIGKPVTKNGFHLVKHKIKDMPVNIYDSWGLEVGKEEQWERELNEELKGRGIDTPASDWFHSIFYCVAAPNARFQDADRDIIKRLIDEKYKVSIILTKADAISEEDEAIFVKAIKNEVGNNIVIIPVCSEQKKTRGGEINPFGREDVEKQSIVDLIDSLIVRIPEHCRDAMMTTLNKWQSRMTEKIRDDLGFFGFNASELHDELTIQSKKIAEEIIRTGENKERNALSCYSFIAERLNGKLVVGSRKKFINSIPDREETPFDWKMIPFVPFLVAALPFYAPFMKKDDEKKMNNMVNEFCQKMREQIDVQVQSLSISLELIKNEVKENLS